MLFRFYNDYKHVATQCFDWRKSSYLAKAGYLAIKISCGKALEVSHTYSVHLFPDTTYGANAGTAKSPVLD